VDPDPGARKMKKKCTFSQLLKHFYKKVGNSMTYGTCIFYFYDFKNLKTKFVLKFFLCGSRSAFNPNPA
jgi:hypothetical protein